MKKIIGQLFLFAAIAAAAGCEWESFNSGDTPLITTGFDWVNFTGTYRPAAGSGALVLQPGYTATSSTNSSSGGSSGGVASVTNTVTGETNKIADGVSTFYSGVLAHPNVIPSTVSFAVGIWGFVDNGLGALNGTAGITGTVTYATGNWTLDFRTIAPALGEQFLARYQYRSAGIVTPVVVTTNTTVTVIPGQGNTGKAIFTMSLTQTGNRLDAYDSNGDQYQGSLLSVSSTAGAGQAGAAGTVVASYELTGLGKMANVTIQGTLLGSYTVAQKVSLQEQLILQRLGQSTSSASQSSLDERTITGTWIEHGPQGDVVLSANIQGVVDAPSASTSQNNSNLSPAWLWYYTYGYWPWWM